jgi:hypothetical protein
MGESTKGASRNIILQRESTPGPMGESTMGSGESIVLLDTESSLGPMGESTTGNGRMLILDLMFPSIFLGRKN